jgi:septal ring factor EnvC (AmiA/AmiB activator)
MISIYLVLINFSFAFGQPEVKAVGLEYKDTLKESMSKYQRINYIEKYLNRLKPTIEELNTSQDKKSTEQIAVLKNSVESIHAQLTLLDKRLIKIEKQLNGEEKNEKTN